MTPSIIRQTIETIALEKLGADFGILPLLFSPEANDGRSAKNGISVLWGEMNRSSDVSGVSQLLSVTQDYTLRIVFRTFVRADDQKAVTRTEQVYDAVSEILKAVVQNRMNLTQVNEVQLRGVSTPRPVDEDQRDTMSIEVRFSVSFVIT